MSGHKEDSIQKMAKRFRPVGAEVLNLPVNKAILFDGCHYYGLDVPYYAKYDSKADNSKILISKNVQECAKNVSKNVERKKCAKGGK